jgi:thymidylate synthase
MVNLSKWPKPKIIVAIDPDVERNGVATVFPEIRELHVQTLPFAQLLDYLLAQSKRYEAEGKAWKVIIEAGWLSKTNWHLKKEDTKLSAAAKGKSAGRNEQVSRLLGEMCKYWGIPYEHVKPLNKIWKGHDNKITADELAQVIGRKIRTNQEGRDAALLAWHHADIPVRLDAKAWREITTNKTKRLL